MEINGKIIQVLPIQTGEGKKGVWKKQDIIIETADKFPKKICLSVWGKLVGENKYRVGASLWADIAIESQEYNGRWYTEVKIWRIN